MLVAVLRPRLLVVGEPLGAGDVPLAILTIWESTTGWQPIIQLLLMATHVVALGRVVPPDPRLLSALMRLLRLACCILVRASDGGHTRC